MKHALKYLVLSTLIFSCGAGTMKVIEQLDSSLERAGAPPSSQEAPALPSIQDIQRLVGAEPDGKLGPETQRLWDAAYNEQCAGTVNNLFDIAQ